VTRRRAPIAVYLRPAEIEALVEAATSALEAFPSSPERFDALGDARRALERARERADKRAEARSA
jgi:hypothetical protein